jgi:hypothetical protein
LTRRLKEMMVLARIGSKVIAQTSPVGASYWAGIAEDAKRIKVTLLVCLRHWLRDSQPISV